MCVCVFAIELVVWWFGFPLYEGRGVRALYFLVGLCGCELCLDFFDFLVENLCCGSSFYLTMQAVRMAEIVKLAMDVGVNVSFKLPL